MENSDHRNMYPTNILPCTGTQKSMNQKKYFSASSVCACQYQEGDMEGCRWGRVQLPNRAHIRPLILYWTFLKLLY